MKLAKYGLLLMILISLNAVLAEDGVPDKGFTLGTVHFSPEVQAGVAHDSRAATQSGEVVDDVYSEVEGRLAFQNLPARYRFDGEVRYGYRFYNDLSEINDDFYSARFSLGTSDSPLMLTFMTEVSKDLDYRTDFDPNSGTDRVLTDAPNLRSLTLGTIGYDQKVTEYFSIQPSYSFEHYYKELTESTEEDVAEWQVHSGKLELRRIISEKTLVNLGGALAQQVNKDENGTIGTVYAGGEGRFTDKLNWRMKLGFSAVDYELSGQEYSGVSDLYVGWNTTEKLTMYTFAGNEFQPGYSGEAARLVSRAGYGLNWKFYANWALSGDGLHSHEEALGSTVLGSYEGFKHFFNLNIRYRFMKNLELAAGGAYTRDELEDDKLVVRLRLSLSY